MNLPAPPLPIQTSKDGTVLIQVKATPGSRRPSIELSPDGAFLRVRVNAAPSDGAANRAIIKALSTLLSVPQRTIELLHGTQSRDKRFRLGSLSLEEVRDRLETLRSGGGRGQR